MKLNQKIVDFHVKEEKKNHCYLTSIQYSEPVGAKPFYLLTFSPSTSGIGHQIRISKESSKLDIESYKKRYFDVIEKAKSNQARAIALRYEIMESKAIHDLIKLGCSINITPSFGINQIFI